MIKKIREPANGFTHFFAAIGAAIGSGVLIYLGRNSLIKTVALGVCGASLLGALAHFISIAVFIAPAAY